MPNKKYKKPPEENKADEPLPAYQPVSPVENHITFFNSFEEMNDSDRHYFATLTPEERLHLVLEMRNLHWPDDHLDNLFGNTIYFDK